MPHLTPLNHRRLKHHRRTKFNKTMHPASPSSIFHTKFTISELKNKLVFHPTVTELGQPVSESSVWDGLDWEPNVITTTLYLTAIVESLKYPSIKSWNNPGDISLSWNCASVLKCHNHQSEEQQPTREQKINHHCLNHLQTLHTQ